MARSENCTNVHLARLIASIQKTGLDVHDISRADGSADVLGYEVSPANAYCSGTGKRTARIRSVARTVSSRRAMEPSMVTCPSWHSAILVLSQSLMTASYLRGRLTWFQENHGQSCAKNTDSGRFYVVSAVIGACAGLMSVSVRMRQKKGSRLRFVKDVASLLRRWEPVSERMRFWSSFRSHGAGSRALRSIAQVLGIVLTIGLYQERWNLRDGSQTTNNVVTKGSQTPRFRISLETYKRCCQTNTTRMLIGIRPGKSNELGQQSLLSVCGSRIDQFTNDGRDAGYHQTRTQEGALQVAWAGDLIRIGDESEKEAFGKGPCFIPQRPQRGGWR